jgi:hypothetical protein
MLVNHFMLILNQILTIAINHRFIDTLKNIQLEIYIKLQSIHKPNSCNNNKLKICQQLLN